MAGLSGVDRKAFVQKRNSAAQRAMELAPESAFVLNAVAARQTHEYKWSEAEALYRRALEIDPNYMAVYGNLAILYSFLKRHEEAIVLARRSVELDPLQANSRNNLMNRLAVAGRFDEAIQESQQAIALAPENATTYRIRGRTYDRKKMYPQAIADLEKACEIDKESVSYRIELARIYASSGDRSKAEAIWKENESQIDKVSPDTLAGFYVAVGDHQKALDRLEKAYSDGETGLRGLAIEYTLDPLRSEPRFKELLRKLNLPE